MFLVCLLRRRWFVAKFAVPNFTAGVGNVAAGSQGPHAEKNDRDDQCCRRFRPFYWHCDRDSTQDRERVKDPNEILRAISMFIEPAFSIFIRHRQDAIVSLLAKFINWPCGERADEYQ